MGKIHPYDAGTIIDKLGIALRTGNHCTQPLIESFKIPGTIRASFSFYNTKEEIDIMIEAIKRVKVMFEQMEKVQEKAKAKEGEGKRIDGEY